MAEIVRLHDEEGVTYQAISDTVEQRVTLPGRLRGHVGFSQRANTPFQGLAADGNKLALFRLLRNAFQVCGFIHDEMLVLVPDSTDYDAAVAQVQQILCERQCRNSFRAFQSKRSTCWLTGGTSVLMTSPGTRRAALCLIRNVIGPDRYNHQRQFPSQPYLSRGR